jgi:FAD:protein FMN transferase
MIFRWLGLGLLLCCWSCTSKPKDQPLPYLTLEGKTMGTYYRITYADSLKRNFQEDIEAALLELNAELSTYIDTSLISRFNNSPDLAFALPAKSRHFMPNLNKSREVYEISGGAFDPTVMPLVQYWGFGPKGEKKLSKVDTFKVDSLKQFVGLKYLSWTKKGDQLIRSKKGVQLDFNAIAQGYAVDELGRVLASKGIRNYLVDIGGEVLGKGRNPRNEAWTIGISTPREGAATNEVQTTVSLDNRALATSGNYRKYYDVQGLKVSHTINPATGFPERSVLLSTTVFAPDAMTADAFATTCMVLGLEKALPLIEKQAQLDAYFIYGDAEGQMKVKYTKGLAALFEH